MFTVMKLLLLGLGIYGVTDRVIFLFYNKAFMNRFGKIGKILKVIISCWLRFNGFVQFVFLPYTYEL